MENLGEHARAFSVPDLHGDDRRLFRGRSIVGVEVVRDGEIKPIVTRSLLPDAHAAFYPVYR